MHDVALVGGGPVGVLAAVLLAQHGVHVTVLEQREEISTRPRAIGIHPPAVDALAAAGVDVAADGVPITEGVAFADRRELGRMRFRRPVLSLPQQEVERMLRARLATLAPAALRLGVRVAEVTRTPDGWHLPGVDVSARVLVGADGIGSVVREGIGVGWEPRSGMARYAMADLYDGRFGQRALLSFERGGVVESFPMPGGRRRWVALLDDRRLGADGEEGDRVRGSPKRGGGSRTGLAGSTDTATTPVLAALVAERTGIDIDRNVDVSVFTARQHLASRFAGDGVALIGDAAHEVSPIGGQGLNLGWLDATALAKLLVRHPEPSPAEWAGFDRARRAAARRAMAQAAFNMRVGGPLPAPLHRARSLGIRLLALPPARTILADRFTMRGL